MAARLTADESGFVADCADEYGAAIVRDSEPPAALVAAVEGRLRSDVTHPLEFSRLERIDPKTGRVDRRLQTATGASVIAAGGDALWSTGLLPGRVRGAARLRPPGR